MWIDKFLEFADATALTTATATDSALVGNVVDTNVDIGNGGTNTLLDWGTGRPVFWVVSVDTDFAGVSGTSQFQLASDSTANLATSRTNHITSPAFTTAQLVAGFTWSTALPSQATYERYLGVWHTQATATLTAGKINSYLTYDPPAQTQYQDAVPT